MGSLPSAPSSCLRTLLKFHRIAARVAVVGTITDVVPVVQSLARTIEKTHHDRDTAIDLDIHAPDARFRGERQDLGYLLP